MTTIQKSFCEQLEARRRVRELAAEAKRRMGDKERQQLNVNEVVVLGAIGITWLICSTVLIANGQPKEVPILSGIVLLLAGVSRFLSKQQKVEQKAEADRQIIRADVEETKKQATAVAEKVNGVTETALEEVKSQCKADVEAIERKHATDMEAKEKNHQRERHDLKENIGFLKLEVADAKAEARVLREQLLKYEQPPVRPNPATEKGEANIP